MEQIAKRIVEIGAKFKELEINDFLCWENIIPLNVRMGYPNVYNYFYGFSSVHIFSGEFSPIPHIIVELAKSQFDGCKNYFIGNAPYKIDNKKNFLADDSLTEQVLAFLEDVIAEKIGKIEKAKGNDYEKDFDTLLNKANELLKINGVTNIVAEKGNGKCTSISFYDTTYNDKAYGLIGRINIGADKFNLYSYTFSALLCGSSNSCEFTMDNIDFIERGMKYLKVI